MNFGNKLKQLKYENLKVFIRSDVHAVRAGIKLKELPPLNNPGVFRQVESGALSPAFIYVACIKAQNA